MSTSSRRRILTASSVFLINLLFPVLARPQMPVFSVQVDRAEQQDVADWLEFTGTIEPWRVIDLAAQVEGRVQEVAIEEGERLRAGETVCTLDSEAIRIELDRLAALQRKAEAELELRESGFRGEDVEAARRQLQAAQARLESARDEWERQAPLVAEGIISESEGTRLRSAYREAQAEVQAAESELAKQEAGFRSEEIESARADVAIVRAQVAEAQRRLRRSTVVTPVDGVVVERLREPGEWVAIGDAVARVAVLDPLKVRIELPQIYLSQVKEGLQATIRVDGFPGREFQAEVARIIPLSGADTRNFPLWMRLANEDNLLRGGLFARVMLSLGEQEPRITVPGEAIQIRGERLVVLVADPIPADMAAGGAPPGSPAHAPAEEGGPGPGGAAEPGAGGPPGMPPMPTPNALIREVEVRTGPKVDGRVALEIVDGGPIRPGDQVVVLGGNQIANGMPVLVMQHNLLAPSTPGAEASGAAPSPTGDTAVAESPAG